MIATRTAGRIDPRSAALLTLALVPIFGVLAVALVWISGAAERDAALDREMDRIVAASNMAANRNVFARALHVFQIAALPDQTAIALDRAEQITSSLRFESTGVRDLNDLTTNTIGGGATASIYEDTEGLKAAVAAGLSQHELGAAIDPALLELEHAINVGLSKGGLAALLSQQQRLGPSTNLLRALIEFEMDFDADLRATLRAAAAGSSTALPKLLAATPLRPLQWQAQQQTWTFQPVAVSRSLTQTLGSGPAIDAFQAFVEATSPREQSLALVQLLAVDTQLRAAVDAATEAAADGYAIEQDRLSAERRRNIAIFASILALGIGLVALSRVELRRRTAVEAAHANALAQMENKAYHDQLTGLKNRYWLDEHLPVQLRTLKLDHKLALVYMDLDGFKSVNDVWGHDTGDQVLRNVAARLTQWSLTYRHWEFVRFGGDEFLGILPFAYDGLDHHVEQLLLALSSVETTNPKGHAPLQVNATAGVAVARVGTSADDLVLRADTALAMAKRTRRGTVQFYRDSGSRVGELLPLIPDALEDNQFRVHLQPIIDLQHDEVAFSEALVRWHRPDGTVLGPDEFVPFAETYGLADRLTAAVIRDIGRVGLENPYLPWVWINVSPIELNGRGFTERFLSHLEAGSLEPHNIGIEITESSAIANVEQVAATLRVLRDAGVLIAIDDFGAGYTPLGHLRTLPVDIIKIDGGLMAGIDRDPLNQAIVQGFYRTAHGLGCDVVAEGIERVEELQWVIDSGIRYAQGYLLGEPTAPSDFVKTHMQRPSVSAARSALRSLVG